ncbi:MAG: DUF1232 domain-containing protein [Candidatus Rokubacteria bacterium]|nr:DUF1232 domain-containing protein [Candidatus Rokubacteria bacterium]
MDGDSRRETREHHPHRRAARAEAGRHRHGVPLLPCDGGPRPQGEGGRGDRAGERHRRARGREPSLKALLRALPDIGRLIARLVADPVLPRTAKIALGAAALYLLSPVDLIPDLIPFLGYADDVLLAAIVVDGILNYVDRALVLKYWPGSAESLDRVARAARVLAAWVPRRLKARVFGPR